MVFFFMTTTRIINSCSFLPPFFHSFLLPSFLVPSLPPSFLPFFRKPKTQERLVVLDPSRYSDLYRLEMAYSQPPGHKMNFYQKMFYKNLKLHFFPFFYLTKNIVKVWTFCKTDHYTKVKVFLWNKKTPLHPYFFVFLLSISPPSSFSLLLFVSFPLTLIKRVL